ncbi:hypothetical protein C7B62_24020 [Pleurocapsa sp. CCALA 161]|nr:hypothetical protein C7B62_24020 [Pleurocapsa sp. CCALA 161]
MDLLGLSESAVNKLVDDGHISFNRIGTNGKRVFNKNTVQEFKSSPAYRSLKKQSIVVYLRCTTKEQEKTLRCKVNQYCKQNNFKANIISQLDRGRQEIAQESYRKAINYIFDSSGISGLIYFGDTNDVLELRKIFQLREGTFVYGAQEIELKTPFLVKEDLEKLSFEYT